MLTTNASRARDRGLRPILHLDTHGDEAKGLEIRPEQTFIGWDDLGNKLRCINVHMHNNLAVVGATCFGLQAIKSVSLDMPAPFFLLLAPPKKVFEHFLEEHIPAFYRSVFELQPVNEAHLQHLAPEFRYFHCEKMLFIVIARYI
ncbi:MAG: hypothetical protein KGI64_03490, partial [Xanthomonadaceae bacterium]|nr:hypothetical protein [Xanthomonadaceae bacterium]